MTLEKRPDDAEPRPAKLTARDFWLLADSGAFANHARTELIEGEIWVVNSVHRWHARVMGKLIGELTRAVEKAGLKLELLAAGSVSLSDDSVPEPDISVIAPMDDGAKTILREELKIAIEISDSSEKHDMGRKAQLYARHGIPEYWVINRDRREVIQMWSSGDGGYAERRDLKFGDRVEAATINGLAVETAGIN
ncbi:MAG TPA: Uma2 family endonuclease [Allosphingosinicella sp.]|jgi:Uma2 family endonuclease